jgi:hypothetical protein
VEGPGARSPFVRRCPRQPTSPPRQVGRSALPRSRVAFPRGPRDRAGIPGVPSARGPRHVLSLTSDRHPCGLMPRWWARPVGELYAAAPQTVAPGTCTPRRLSLARIVGADHLQAEPAREAAGAHRPASSALWSSNLTVPTDQSHAHGAGPDGRRCRRRLQARHDSRDRSSAEPRQTSRPARHQPIGSRARPDPSRSAAAPAKPPDPPDT